jgi:hypothetical protein
MSRPILSKVSQPPLLNVRDINLFAIPELGMQDPVFLLCMSVDMIILNVDIHPTDGSSLEGQRSTVDFFKILDVIVASASGDYKLQKLDNERRPSGAPLLERSSEGNITAGNYLICKFTLSHMCSRCRPL